MASKIIRNLEDHRALVHPRILRALDSLQDRTAVGVDYDFWDRYCTSRHGDVLRIVESYRSARTQMEMYKAGRTLPGNIITNALPYRSYHQWGLAVDLVFTRFGYDDFNIAGEDYYLSVGSAADATVDNVRASWGALDLPGAMTFESLQWLGSEIVGGKRNTFFDPGHFQHGISVPSGSDAAGTPWWDAPGGGFVPVFQHSFGEFAGDIAAMVVGDREAEDLEGVDRLIKADNQRIVGKLVLGGIILWLVLEEQNG